MRPGSSTSGLDEAMAMLALDALALRVVGALQDAGVPVLLMKGPVTAGWLYDAPAERTYSDVDLLVPPDRRHDAAGVLRGLGLHDHHATVLAVYRPEHEEAWLAEEGAVDLHWSVAGVPPGSWDLLWRELAGGADDVDLLGRRVPAPGEVGRTLGLALHAATSAPGEKARADLVRGVLRVPVETWREALGLAGRTGSREAFVSGLSLQPQGRRLLGELGVQPSVGLAAALYDARAPARVVLWAVRPDLAGARPGRWLRELLRVRSPELGTAQRAHLSATGALDVLRGRLQLRRWRRRVGPATGG